MLSPDLKCKLVIANIAKQSGKLINISVMCELLRYIRNDVMLTIILFICVSHAHAQDNIWGNIEYKGEAWVKNVSHPNKISRGLQDAHLSLWASHGRYYNITKNKWLWQRPDIFCTNEDLFTQTIVVPYLIPMLENAGAVVFTPRERDWQPREVIVDNDDADKRWYGEKGVWHTAPVKGFALHGGTYQDRENPFEAGTTRMINTSSNASRASNVSYQPFIPEEGRYAVYVSYQTLPNSIDNAQYTVYHKGIQTTFKVNQQMGGGTWVYLGTFYFSKGSSTANMVVLTNHSKQRGVVTADAVRFGGGMGNIERGGTVSGMPRSLEGARYYAQWAGAPTEVYRSKNGTDDYAEDINARPLMTNWLAGGSVFMPAFQGKNVPIELSLAVHSDAGYSNSLIGTLAICTTNTNDTKLNSGVSRMLSYDFSDSLLTVINRDITAKYGKWMQRGVRNDNYAETRLPEVPAAIIETLAHQNFNDMLYGQDPNFRFTLARAIYKTMLKFVAEQHGRKYIVEPLAPSNFAIKFVSKNKVQLSWIPTNDPMESAAKPTSYNIYTAKGKLGFDNGDNIKGTTYTLKIDPNVQYNFRVTAVNSGGESFTTETLSAYYHPNADKTILVVNGFNRLSSPFVINNDTVQGFDIAKDIGVNAGVTAGWAGKQINFNKAKTGINGAGGLGFSGEELAGSLVGGNDFNYTVTHTQAIAHINRYNIVSCSADAVNQSLVDLSDYDCVDLILGLQKDDRHSLVSYKTFTPTMQQALTKYTSRHGRLFVSGAYIGSDMTTPDEQQFLSDILKVRFAGTTTTYSITNPNRVNMQNTDIYITHTINDKHYAVTEADIFTPLAPASDIIWYDEGYIGGVAYADRTTRCVTFGFPFECITSEDSRNFVMSNILKYLME